MANTVPAMRLQLVPIPVADIDRAKAFYVDKLGFNLDHDVTPSEGVRVVQMTPPDSACSIVVATGVGDFDDMTPGTIKGLHLVVDDIVSARAALIERGVAMQALIEYPGGIKYAGFADPDGNTWTLQEIATEA